MPPPDYTLRNEEQREAKQRTAAFEMADSPFPFGTRERQAATEDMVIPKSCEINAISLSSHRRECLPQSMIANWWKPDARFADLALTHHNDRIGEGQKNVSKNRIW